MYNSFMYVIFNDGVNTEKSYPYEGIVSTSVSIVSTALDLLRLYYSYSKRPATSVLPELVPP